MGRVWLFGRGVRFREAVGCTAAGVGALPLALASGGLVRCASMVRGSGGLRSRVCGFMHRDEGAEHRKTGERGTVGNTPVWNKCPECYTEDRHGAENSCLWKSGKMLENLDFH